MTFEYDPTNPSHLISVETTNPKLVFPKEITVIVDGTTASSPFSKCKGIVTNVSFAQGSLVQYIGKYCFYNAQKLISADLSNCKELQTLSKGLFLSSKLETIILPMDGKINAILAGAFMETKIQTISIPDSVTNLEGHTNPYGGVFTNCYSLTTINISKNSKLKSIGYAIAQRSSVRSFFIPKGVDSLNSAALNLMPYLKTITVDENNEFYISIDDMVYSRDRKTLILCACAKQTPIKFEKEMTEISTEAFRGCRRTEELVIPEPISIIYMNTFYDARFPSIIFPNTLTQIDSHVFAFSTLQSLTIPSSVTKISSCLTRYSQVRTITILPPQTQLVIGNMAFANSSVLESIEIPAYNVSIDIKTAFTGCNSLKDIYYSFPDFPQAKTSLSQNIRYFAKIYSKNDKLMNINCGKIQVFAEQNYCHIHIQTCRLFKRNITISLLSFFIFCLTL